MLRGRSSPGDPGNLDGLQRIQWNVNLTLFHLKINLAMLDVAASFLHSFLARAKAAVSRRCVASSRPHRRQYIQRRVIQQFIVVRYPNARRLESVGGSRPLRCGTVYACRVVVGQRSKKA